MIERTHDVKLMVGPNGEVILPADALERLGLDDGGGVVFLTFGDEGARLETLGQRMAMVARVIGAGPSSTELLRQRRQAAAQQERDRRGALA